MKMVVEEKRGDSLEPVKVPHSLHSFKRDEKDKEVRRSRIVALNLQFWNVGLQMKGLGSKFKVEVEVRIENITNVQIGGWVCVAERTYHFPGRFLELLQYR